MATERRLFHIGRDGDGWFLCYCPEACCLYVAHELPEPASGITMRVELRDLLRRYPGTPEQEALQHFIGALLLDASHPQNSARPGTMRNVVGELFG
jgi:hypothetical protein